MQFVIQIPSELKHVSGIYIIKNNKNKKVYVGRTKKFSRRANNHKKAIENDMCNSKFREIIKEYPDIIFYFVPILKTDNLKIEEEKFIIQYDSVKNGLNVCYNDEEIKNFLQEHKFLKKQPYKGKKIEIDEKTERLWKSGYIRKDKLYYKPQTAAALLRKAIVKRKKEKSQNRRKMEHIVDFSFLVK